MRDRVMADVQSLSAQMLHLQGVLKKLYLSSLRKVQNQGTITVGEGS